MSEPNLDYLNILKALDEIPFGVGKKLLCDYLTGKSGNDSINKHKLYDNPSYGSLAYSDKEVFDLIDTLMNNGYINTTSLSKNRFWKVLVLSPKGSNEIEKPTFYKKKASNLFSGVADYKTDITDQDRQVFSAFGDFLKKYNEEQCKAIVSAKNHILCIAGAGSGKTTVLTKRIEFLTKYKSVDPKKILAITFTRKARTEMVDRLSHLPNVTVETFNSFCEKLLKKHNDLLYDREVRVINYRDKIQMMLAALKILGKNIDQAVEIYFTFGQRRGKTRENLANIFMNDCFFIRDYFKFKNKPLEESDFIGRDHENSAKLVYGVCNYIESYMKKHGMRDFADQLIDTLSLFETNPELIPSFDHILVDEYQDVNSTQIKLIDTLNSDSVFAVGDPRQSIYGWRGSDIKYILNFPEKYDDCEIISLTKNYRSNKLIVDLINKSIASMKLPDLESGKAEYDGCDSSVNLEKDVKLLNFKAQEAEFEFVIQRILASNCSRSEIFVLARTNKLLKDFSERLKMREISHVLRSDELRKTTIANDQQITLATIHAIKGLEAEMVFVIGSDTTNFPCRGSEHPVVEMIKVDEYNKEDEEQRLFYVALSRAKKSLYITYSKSKLTKFVNSEMQKQLNIFNSASELSCVKKNKRSSTVPRSGDIMADLREWRNSMAREFSIPAYMIMHDKTLFDIAQRMPMSEDELTQVYGLGGSKISKYGEDILKIING